MRVDLQGQLHEAFHAGPRRRELVDAAVESLQDSGCRHRHVKVIASVGVVPQIGDGKAYQRMEAVCDHCRKVGKAYTALEVLM